jgi:predicted RNA binding protein YcfA (HicA-like mRNA interferase family)
MKIAAVLKLIESDGWVHTRTRGSHRQYRHPTKPGVVTVAGKPRDELHAKTLASILRQAGLKNDTGGTDESSKGGQA